MSDIEGKVTRVGASECGQRASFKAATTTKQFNPTKRRLCSCATFCSEKQVVSIRARPPHARPPH
jgi:hypothetical protein